VEHVAGEDFKKMEDYRHKTGVAAPEEDRRCMSKAMNTPRRIEDHRRCAAQARLFRARAEKVMGANFVGVLGQFWSLVRRVLGLVFATAASI